VQRYKEVVNEDIDFFPFFMDDFLFLLSCIP
jgi:hypothetical protein